MIATTSGADYDASAPPQPQGGRRTASRFGPFLALSAFEFRCAFWLEGNICAWTGRSDGRSRLGFRDGDEVEIADFKEVPHLTQRVNSPQGAWRVSLPFIRNARFSLIP